MVDGNVTLTIERWKGAETKRREYRRKVSISRARSATTTQKKRFISNEMLPGVTPAAARRGVRDAGKYVCKINNREN